MFNGGREELIYRDNSKDSGLSVPSSSSLLSSSYFSFWASIAGSLGKGLLSGLLPTLVVSKEDTGGLGELKLSLAKLARDLVGFLLNQLQHLFSGGCLPLHNVQPKGFFFQDSDHSSGCIGVLTRGLGRKRNVWRNELEGRALSPSWKEHSHEAIELEEDAVTCELIMTSWLRGRDS
nr:hypothetical protein CFP56_37704 [Quercus suber]